MSARTPKYAVIIIIINVQQYTPPAIRSYKRIKIAARKVKCFMIIEQDIKIGVEVREDGI